MMSSAREEYLQSESVESAMLQPQLPASSRVEYPEEFVMPQPPASSREGYLEELVESVLPKKGYEDECMALVVA
jgi:hypothetical protein